MRSIAEEPGFHPLEPVGPCSDKCRSMHAMVHALDELAWKQDSRRYQVIGLPRVGSEPHDAHWRCVFCGDAFDPLIPHPYTLFAPSTSAGGVIRQYIILLKFQDKGKHMVGESLWLKVRGGLGQSCLRGAACLHAGAQHFSLKDECLPTTLRACTEAHVRSA